MTRKNITVIAAIVAIVAILAVGSLAYFTDTENAENTFTVGKVDIRLTEPGWKESGKGDAKTVYPGEGLKKDPTVTNVGPNPCFVRIKVEGLDCLGDEGMITYETQWVTGALGEGWVLDTDGYFYYTKVVYDKNNALGKSNVTTPLFEQIRMPKTLTNGDPKIEKNIIVTAEAVQAQGAKPSFSAVQTMTVAEIAAWFTTCGF